jgi:hypothetical protein
MALAHSTSIVRNGLAFYYDMGNSPKSWRGRPLVNQFALPEADVNGFGVQNGTFTRIRTGTFAGYDIQPLDYVWRYNIVGNECPYHGNDVTISAGQTATFSFDYYVDASTSNYVVTNVLAVFEGVVSGAVGDPTPSIKGVWKRAVFSVTAGSTGLCRMLLYPGSCGGRLGDSGFILYRNPQVEFDAPGLAASPFVASTRYSNSNLESTPSYPTWNATAGSSASGGTLTFSGGSYNSKSSWDLYKTYSGLSTGVNYTWSVLVKLGTASNFIVTMNNAQSWNTGPSNVFAGLSSTEWTRVAITGTTNSGSFNIHLGASFNTEVASTSQGAGTVYIQDVRLVLSGSQTAISDLMDLNTINASSLTYASDGTFSFTYSNPSYISIPLASAFNKTEGTMNFWVYPTRYNGGNGYFVNREDSTANATDWFWIGPYSDTFYFRLGNGSDCCSNDLSFGSVSSVIPLNTWTNMCFSWRANGTSVIYKNGMVLTSRSIGNVPNTNPASNGRIGLGHGNADDYFNGRMPSVQIYNRQLTDIEVSQNFNAIRGRYGI